MLRSSRRLTLEQSNTGDRGGGRSSPSGNFQKRMAISSRSIFSKATLDPLSPFHSISSPLASHQIPFWPELSRVHFHYVQPLRPDGQESSTVAEIIRLVPPWSPAQKPIGKGQENSRQEPGCTPPSLHKHLGKSGRSRLGFPRSQGKKRTASSPRTPAG